MRTIKWFGGVALVAAAAVALFLSQASAESVLLRAAGTTGALSAAARGQLAAMAALCGSGQLAAMDSVCVKRSEGADASLFILATQSARVLTADEVKAQLRLGVAVPRGRTLPAKAITCTLAGAQLTAAQTLVRGFARAGAWDGNPDTLLEFCATRSGSTWSATSVSGLIAKDIDAVATDTLTQDVAPLGIVQ